MWVIIILNDRLAHEGTTEQKHLSLHHLLEKIYPQSKPSSKYVYLEVLDQTADSRETILDVINRLYKEFEIGNTLDHLVVGGDAKTYKLLQSIKLDYGEELSWLLPFPGDFHILMNYQPVLSKIYFDAGLKQLASASGFKGETLTALRKRSHFKHAHRFFMGAWEAIYIHMASTFISTNTEVSQLFEALKEVEDNYLHDTKG